MSVITIDKLTKDYGHGRGVFDISFRVEAGEVFGFLGPNGAGKTTTIRHIMGFSKPDKGRTSVYGLESWKDAHQIQKKLGYLPGEIALPENLSGTEFIQMMAALRAVKTNEHTKYLIDRFELDPSGSLKRMSLGMKRKLAIVTAFMHDPDVLVLDEPTSGLDPLMQDIFIEFIKEEKDRGKTILMSSHIFKEVDLTCDRIAIIKDGRIASLVVADDIRHNENKTYKLEFKSQDDYKRFTRNETFVTSMKAHKNQVKVEITDERVNDFITAISAYDLKFISEIKFTLEDYFMHFYDRNDKGGASRCTT